MPTATITIDAGAAGTMINSKAISGASLSRFVAAVRVAYNVPPDKTDIEALSVWADFVWAQAKSTTKGVEQAAASAAVTDIVIS